MVQTIKNLVSTRRFSSFHGGDLLPKGGQSTLVILVGKLKEMLVSMFFHVVTIVVIIVTSHSSGKLHVLSHDGDSLGMDGAEASILENADEIGLGCLLKGNECLSLESKVVVDVTANVSDKSLEWSSWNEKISALLIPFDLSERDST